MNFEQIGSCHQKKNIFISTLVQSGKEILKDL